MSILKFEYRVQAHKRTQVTRLLKIEGSQDRFISIAHDGYLKVWDASSCLSKVQQVYIGSAYLNSICYFKKHYYVGLGTGFILELNQAFQVQRKDKFHSDCVSAIHPFKDFLITLGYDGKIVKIDLLSFTATDSFQLDRLINEAIIVQDKIYIGANPGFIFDAEKFQIQKTLQHRVDTLVLHANQVYMASDDRGMSNLNRHWNPFIPCQFMLSLNDKSCLLFFSDDSVGILKNQGEFCKWGCQRQQCFEHGYSLKSGISYDKRIFLTGQDGFIYQFTLDTNQVK